MAWTRRCRRHSSSIRTIHVSPYLDTNQIKALEAGLAHPQLRLLEHLDGFPLASFARIAPSLDRSLDRLVLVADGSRLQRIPSSQTRVRHVGLRHEFVLGSEGAVPLNVALDWFDRTDFADVKVFQVDATCAALTKARAYLVKKPSLDALSLVPMDHFHFDALTGWELA